MLLALSATVSRATPARWELRSVSAGEVEAPLDSALAPPWDRSGSGRVTLDGAWLGTLEPAEVVVITWSGTARDGGVRATTEVPVATWHAAGRPDGLRVTPSGVELDGPLAPPPTPHAVASCPDDLLLECSAGVDVLRQAWLDAFTGSADPGCGTASRSLQVTPGTGGGVPSVGFADFSDLSDWTLNGAAALQGNPVLSNGRRVLRLTSSYYESGSAFLTQPLTLDADASFAAKFSFRISDPVGSPDWDGEGADGIVFVVQTVTNSAGGDGGGLGYEGLWPSVGVEIDTWNNGWQDDEDGNHVGIDVNGMVDSVDLAHVAQRMNDGDVWHAWVEYDGSTDLLTARLSLTDVRPATATVSHVVDLPAVLGSPDVFVGFTSGTGAAIGKHDILSLEFDAAPSGVRCAGERLETVVATITDACGRVATCSRSFEVRDTTPPALVSPAPAGCFRSLDEARDAVAATSSATDACGSATLAVTVSPTADCAGVVLVRASDECGNATQVEHPVTTDTLTPQLYPIDPFGVCGDTLHAIAGPDDRALASPRVTWLEDCPGVVVVNDRTPGGPDATDTYPCGLTPVTFTITDACGRASSCGILVSVQPSGPLPDVGGALRVRRTAAGPLLDWSLATTLGESHAVLASDGVRHLPIAARTGTSVRWTDAGPTAPIRWYDVRTIDCAGGLSVD